MIAMCKIQDVLRFLAQGALGVCSKQKTNSFCDRWTVELFYFIHSSTEANRYILRYLDGSSWTARWPEPKRMEEQISNIRFFVARHRISWTPSYRENTTALASIEAKLHCIASRAIVICDYIHIQICIYIYIYI